MNSQTAVYHIVRNRSQIALVVWSKVNSPSQFQHFSSCCCSSSCSTSSCPLLQHFPSYFSLNFSISLSDLNIILRERNGTILQQFYKTHSGAKPINCTVHTVQLLLHNSWSPKETHPDPFGKKTFQMQTL